MNVHRPAPGPRWPGLLTNLAVVVVVVALAGATFVLSYAGVHEIALAAGVPETLARLYPAIFDAVLVVACTAALTLRDATLWARLYAWLSIIVLVAVIGTADVIHATGVRLPHRQTAGTVAALPWALVMLGFSLWLTMLRHARAQQAASGGVAPEIRPVEAVRRTPQPAPPAPEELRSHVPVPQLANGEPPGDGQRPGGEAAQAEPEAPVCAAETEAREEAKAPFTWEAHAEPFTDILPFKDEARTDEPALAADAAPDPDATPQPPAPHLRRVRSTPTPPEP
jgi:Protein of unknown function (DUF2637)